MNGTSAAAVRRIARYYDETQVLYTRLWSRDGVHYGLWDASTRGRREAIRNLDRCVARELSLPAGSRVLDAGCGVGGTSLFLARQHQYHMTGLTLSQHQLRVARRSAASLPAAQRPAFLLRDYLDTGLGGGSFDGAFAIESACYAESTPALLRELHRVLRPGGRLVVTDGFRRRLEPADAPRYARLLRGFALTHLADADEFEAQLHDAGFSDVRRSDKRTEILPSAAAIERLSWLGIAVCALPCALGLFPRAWLDHGLAGISQRPLFERGSIQYCVFSATKPLRADSA
jgi:cyclopropane fatty-acyl-phospholipid synthase-like methyltransferase